MKQSECYLLVDVYSVFHSGKAPLQYGYKGEKVRIISEHGNVVIVEGKGGRFPVSASSLTGR